jgi:acyl-coenzyme A thioesterase PaaI-like protein
VSTAPAWPPADAQPPVRHPDAPAPGTPIPSHYRHCFGCGADAENGLRLRATVGEGMSVHAEFAVTAGHQGAPGLAHGGLLAAAFDEALGSLAPLYRRPAVTGKLETDFRRPVPVGSTLMITATVDGTSGRKIYCSADGRLNSHDGPVAVRARAVFVTVDLSHFTEHGRPEDVRAVLGEQSSPTYDVNP